MSDSYDLSFLTGSSPELSANQNGLITPEQARDLATREIITGQRPDFSGSNPDVTLANESLYAQAKQQADIALGNVNTRSAGEAVQDTAVSGLQGAATLANMASLAAGGGAVQAASQQNSNIATAMALNQAWNNVRNFFSPPATEEEAQQRQDEVDRANTALYQSFNPDPASTGLYAAAQVNAAINDFIEEDIGSLHSDAYQQRKAEKDRRSEYLQQLSDAQYDQDVASGTSSLKAGLRQFGRDAINWIDENSSVADIVDTSANAAGQVLGQGAVIGAGRRMIAGPSTAALVQRARRVAEQRAQEEAAAQAVKNAADKAVAAARTDAERASARTAAQTATQNANLAHEAAEAAAIDLAMALKTAQEGAKAAAAKNVAERGRQSFFNKVWDKTKSAGKTLVNHPGEMAFIGLQEGAGTIGSAAQKINQLSNEQLLEQSPLFRQYYERNRAAGQNDKTALDNARVSLIAEAARLEMLQLPAAVAGASFTHAPGNVFGRISPRLNRGLAQNIRNVTGEAVEEAVTGTTGGLISNYAAGETYDPSQRLWSGVGSQAAQGFIASLGATSALNAPSATANTAIGATRIAASPVVKGIRSAKERARQENKQKAADILASANPSGNPSQQQQGQTSQNQQEGAPVTPAQDQAGNINPTPTAANPAPSSGSEGEVDLRTSTGPDERLDNSGILDDSDKSRDDLGRTEAMRYAQKQPDYIFGNQQEYNRLAQTMQTFNDDGAAEGIKELVQLNQNRDKLSPEEQQQLNENLEGLRNGAVDLINLYTAAKDRASGVSDTHRWDKRVFEDAETSGGFRTALENALYLYNNIQTTDNDIKLSEAARKKFINEAKEGNVAQDRLDNIIRHATEFGLTEEQANTLSYIKDTTLARAKAVQFDKSSGAGSVHNNIYNESDGAKFSVTDMIDGIADAAAAQDQAKLQFYLWKLDNLYNALTNKAEALTYGVNQQTGANIEYHSYNSETGEEYSATTYAGSMKQYRTIVKEQNDLADIRDALNQNLRTYYPQMFGDTQYVLSSKVKAANSKLTQNYLKDKTTGEPKVKREANRTISIEERLSNGTHTSGTHSSQSVVSSNAANTGNTSVTTNNTQASAKQILDTVHKKSPSKGINLMYRKWKNLSLQHTTPTGGKGKNNYSIKFGKHLGGEDAANPYAAFLMMRLDPSESENIKKRFRSANRYKTLYRLRDALAKGNYNGTPLKLRSEEDWNKIQKQVLLSCLIAKFNNEPESVQDLISTGNAPLYRYSKTSNGPVNMDLVLADGTTMSEILELLRLAYQNLDAFGGKIPGDLEYSELISTLAQVVNNNQNQENNPTEPEVKETEPEVKAEATPAEPQQQNQKEIAEQEVKQIEEDLSKAQEPENAPEAPELKNASEVIPVSSEPSFDTNVEEEGTVLRDNPVSKVIWNPRTGNLQYKLRNEDGSFRMLVRDGLYDDKGNLLDPATKEVWLKAEQINEIRSNLGMPVGQRVNIIDVIPPETDKENAGNITLSDGTKLRHNPVVDIAQGERVSVANHMRDNAEINRATTSHITNSILNSIRGTVFRAVKPENQTENQKADNDTLIRRLKDAVLGKRKNVDKALDDADTLVKGIELFKEWMNEVALHSQINTELNSGKFFQKMLEGKGRSLTDWVLGLSSTNNARVAVFMSVDSSGNLVFDDKVLTCAFLSMLQAVNDNYTHNTMDEADLEEAVERLGLTMNQFMTLPEEVRQSFVNSIPSSALLQSFNRYFSALMGIRSNNEVSVSYDGDAMINALATQTLAYAQAMNWISYTTNAYTFTSETSGGTEVIQKNIPILEVTQEVKDAMSEAVNAKDYSIKLNSPLLLGSNKEAITKLFTKEEGFKREFYPNEEMPPLEASHKVRTDTEYTKDELKAKAAMRNTKYYLNKRFGKLITTLGTEGLLAIRGIDINPNSEEQRHTYNWKIWNSLVGTRQSLIASYDYNINRMDNLLAIAEQEGIEDPYLRFDFEMTAAGRWMETAPLGPQADKLARQLFTQVRTKITRTKNGTSLTEWGFKLAVLQALGVKLPKFASAEEAADMLEQQFAQVEAIAEHYGDWLEENPDFDDLQTVINQMFADLKAAGFDPMGRSNGGNVGAGSYLVLNTMLNMSDWVKGNDFDCNIFLEHDGSTNGYVNAVFKFASGSRFNEAEIQALFRGSIFPGLGLNRFDYYSKDKEDNYTAVASEAQTSIANFIEEQQDPVVKDALKQMFRAINLIIGNFGDADNTNVNVVIEDNQVYLKVGRNMVKTPVTAVNYGQGENSNAIALFRNIIEDTVYQKMSDAIKYITPNSKQTFGEVYYAKEIAEGTLTKEQANDYFNEIIFTLDVMYTHKFAPAVDTKGKRLGYDVLIPNRAKAKDKSFIDFKDGRPLFDYFNGKTVQKAFENFRFDLLPKNKYQKEGMGSALRNFRKIFADHIFSAVHDLRGGDAVEASMQAINNVTNAMGTVAARLEKKFIQDCINATGRMPSRKELQDFKKKHSWAYPVYTGMTNLNLGVTENTNITDFSSSSYASGVLQMSRGHKDIYNLAGKGAKTITPIYSTPRIPISTLPSVRSLALMVIGLGDGVMQTWFYSHKDYFLKKYGKYGLTEEIFDQVANRYDGFEGSPALQPVIAAMCNEAAFGVLEENPLEGINAIFKNFKQNLFALAQEDIDLVRELIAGTDQFIELDLELGIPLDPNEKSIPSAPPSGSDTFEGQLQMLADTNKAKHDVLHEMPVSVSHVSINEFGYTHSPNGEYLDVPANVGTAEELAVYTAEALSQRVEEKLAKNQKTEAPGNVTLSSTKGTRGTNQKESDISINGKNPNSPGRAPTPPKTHLDWTKVFTNALHKVFGSIQTGSVFKDIIERNLPAGTQVKIMSRGDIIKEQPNAGMDDTTKTALYTSNTIYIVDDGNLTPKERDIRIAHEMVHAVLSYKLNKAYSHTLNDSAAHKAVENLEYLKDQFLAMDFTQNKDLDLNVRTRLISIQRILSEYDGVEAVDEFVAYMLSDPLLKEYLSETTPNETSGVLAHVKEFFNLVKSFVQQVGTLLGIHSKSDLQLLSSFYGQIAVNANVIIDSEYSSEPETGDLVRFMKRGSSTYLQDVIQKMSDTLTSSGLIASKYAGKDQQVTNLVNALTQDMDTALSQAAVSGLLTTPEEVKAARFVMAVFAYNLKGKEAAYQEADALRNVVKKTLHTDDFLENQNWAQAQAQLEILTNMRGYQARSNPVFTNGITYQYDLSLPLFMALATVSPKVRQVLSKKTLTAKDLALGKANEVEIYDRPIDRKIAEVCRNTISSLGSMVMPKSRRITKTGTADAIADMFMEDMANQKVDTAARSIPSTLMTKGETWTKNAISKASGFLAGSEFVHNLQASDNKFGKLAGNAIGGTMQYISIVTSSDGQAEDINQRIHGNLSEKAYDLSKKQGALAKLRGNLILEFTREILHADNYSDLIQQFEKKMKALVAQARSNYRKVVPLEIHRMFRNEGVVLTDAASASMNKVILKPDLGALTNEEVRNILTGTGNNLEAQVRHFESEIMKDPNINKAAAERIMRTSRELADYMIYGKVAFGLLRNPYSILFNAGAKITNENLVLVNKYITLLALKRVSAEDMSTVREIYSKAPNSFEFSLNQQRRMAAYEEARGAASEAALFNRTKGWYPQTATSGASIIAVSAQDRKKYEALGYVVVKGSAAVRNYVYMTNVLNPRANFSQGALQTIMHCAGGADITSGFTTEPVVLRVNPNNRSVNWGKVNNDYEHFVPVFDQNGKVKAYDCLMDTRMVNNVYQYEQDFAKNLGNWLGRQFEEDTAQQWNLAFIDALHQLYQRDVALDRTKGYINLYRVKDPVIQEALSLINPEAQQRIQDLFPEGFYVRRDMVDDVIGHRKASVVDMWTGKSRWSPEAQKAFRDIADKVMGKNACQKLLRAEKVTQALTSIVRNKVVIVSGTVALANLVSNFKQLVISGVPLRVIATETPKIIKELEIYNKSQQRIIALQLQLNSVVGSQKPGWEAQANSISAEIKAEQAAHTHLTIAPLLAAGEYSTIADIGDVNDDLLLSMGKWGEYIDNVVDQIPEGVKNTARYITVAKGTPIYNALEKMTKYGDFVSKAILYNYLVNQGMGPDAAMRRVRYEFVNYDMLPGRGREYLENMGVIWFYNYKLRSVRVFLSMMKHNPIKAVTMSTAGGLLPGIFDSGTPMTDNIVASALTGKALYTAGPQMMLSLPTQNLWYQLFE